MLQFLLVVITVIVSLSGLIVYQQRQKVINFFNQDHPFKIPKEPNKDQKIFVSIASYRDPEAPKTVQNLLDKADHPELLRVVVYEQNDPSDPSVSSENDSVRVFQDHYTEAKGPVWARYLIQQFYDSEEYFMQIDSHSRFVEGWDTKLKHMLNLLPDKSVLTQYPPNYDLNDGSFDIDKIRSGLYIQGFGVPDKMTRVQSDIINSPKLRQNFPYTSKGWAACFSFSKGNIVKDAPYDPLLPHLFFGEELDITLRLYTRGWHFFSPHENVIFTSFKRDHRRTYWQDLSFYVRKLFESSSRKRLCQRLGITFKPEYFLGVIPIDLMIDNISNNTESFKNSKSVNESHRDSFKLGTKRTLGEYKHFSQINSFNDQKLEPRAKTFRRYTRRPLIR